MPDGPARFILNIHLGKLARYLRLLGFDTYYIIDGMSDADIASIASEEQRIVLSRDVVVLKRSLIQFGYWLRSTNVEEQLKEVIERYVIKQNVKPFSCCPMCNGLVNSVDK